MTEVRPTIDVLKELERQKLLPPEVARALQHARKVEDSETRLRLLVDLDLSSLDIPLLRNARSEFAAGLPDKHREMSVKARRPVYEVRDRSGAAWRGAVVTPDEDGCAWLVFVDSHDRFHDTGPDVIGTRAGSGKLGPSLIDRRIRDIEQDTRDASLARTKLLAALLDSLMQSARTAARTTVDTPARYDGAPISIQVTEPVDSEWNPVDAHEEVSDVVVRISFGACSTGIRDELIKTCVPFLQPDSSMRESIYREDLTVQLLITRAGLMQLLATERPQLPVEERLSPRPTVLHYTAKWSLTEAFISGRAVRAVCGQWWIPVGDDSTHAQLPICTDCERESPFAQYAHDLLLRFTEDRG